jgi:hypothetical protein
VARQFQRVRTTHSSVPLVHDLLTNIADSIVVFTGSEVGNGNIVDRAALRALKFIYGTPPRLRTRTCAYGELMQD